MAVVDRFSTSFPAWMTAHAKGWRMAIARRGSLTGRRPERHHVRCGVAFDVVRPRAHDRPAPFGHGRPVVSVADGAADPVTEIEFSQFKFEVGDLRAPCAK